MFKFKTFLSAAWELHEGACMVLKPQQVHHTLFIFASNRRVHAQVLRTMECGYKYLVVLGYDLGDRYYDTPEAHDEVNAWFETNVAGPAREVGCT